MKFKYIIVLILLASFAAIIYGFYIKTTDEFLANKYIGFGTVGIFLIAMPNIEKMQKKERQNIENQ